MPVVFVSVKWTGSEEVFRLDLAKLAKNAQLAYTTESCDGIPPYRYNTSSDFVPDSNGGGALTIRYRAEDNPHLKDLGCRWGETVLTLNRSMKKGKAEWIDAEERGSRKKVYSTTEGDRAEWRRIEPLPFTGTRRRETVERAERAQRKFRDRLLMIDSKCAITGERQPELLEAAHVRSVARGGGDIESNGILLRADLHRLFDAKLFSITPTGRVKVLKGLRSDHYRRLLGEFPSIDKDTFERVKGPWNRTR